MPVAETRRNLVRVTLTDDEVKRLRLAAGIVPVSTWIRSLILDAMEKGKPKK
jgi:hypothetical protein